MTAERASSARQEGQALVAVIVLIALLFLIGTAMTLAVSSSLQTVRQTVHEDWRGYAAESAATRDLAIASDVAPTPGCGVASSQGGDVNGFAVSAMTCAVTQVAAGGIQRDAIAAQNMASGQCVKPVYTLKKDRKAWGTIAWLPPGSTPNIQVLLDEQRNCILGASEQRACSVNPSGSVVYFSCDKDPDHEDQSLHVLVGGTAVRLRAFYIRSADASDPATAIDCVVTSIGFSGGAADEGDLVMPNCTGLPTPPATPPATLFWNRLLP